MTCLDFFTSLELLFSNILTIFIAAFVLIYLFCLFVGRCKYLIFRAGWRIFCLLLRVTNQLKWLGMHEVLGTSKGFEDDGFSSLGIWRSILVGKSVNTLARLEISVVAL